MNHNTTIHNITIFSPDAPALSAARCELKVTTGGPVRLRLNSADGLRLWVNDKSTFVTGK